MRAKGEINMEKDNNIFNIMNSNNDDIGNLKIKLQLLKMLELNNYDYGLSVILKDDTTSIEDKLIFINVYLKSDKDCNVYSIIISPNITIREKLELIKTYMTFKYDDGKLDMTLEEKLIGMMSCLEKDTDSSIFKIFSSNQISIKDKIKIKNKYEELEEYKKMAVAC